MRIPDREDLTNPLQRLVNAMSDAGRYDRSKYHLTLGQLIERLREKAAVDSDMIIRFDKPITECDHGGTGAYPSTANSYRGFYDDLCLEPSDEPMTVGKLLAYLESEVLDKTFTGWKGGEFIMDEKTPLWAAGHGDGGPAIMGITEINGTAFLITKEID